MSRTLNSPLTPPATAPARSHAQPTSGATSLHSPVAGEEPEILEYLGARPVHNVILMSLIRDNGFESRLNRGEFYACRDARGALCGVALIGHHILFAGDADETLTAFAEHARGARSAHVIVGERAAARKFWAHYARAGESPVLVQQELMLEQRWPIAVREAVPGLRPATLDDLAHIATVHAQLAFEESRLNPLEVDAEGFLARLARRVEQGRVWVWVEGGRLIFKSDIFSDATDVIYLEGIYVNPSERGKGYGLRCLSQLSRELLLRAKSLCLLANEENEQVQAFYRRAGYKLHSHFNTIYLPPRA